MGISIEDLIPKTFAVTLKGVELNCQPPRLNHTLLLAKVGRVFENPNATNEQIESAQNDVDKVIEELLPELEGNKLDTKATLQFIQQVMEQIQPDDNKELQEKGVKFDSDPKAQRTG